MERKNNSPYGLYSPGSSGWTSLRNPEFQEADVWEVLQGAWPQEPGAGLISSDHGLSSTSKRLPITPTISITSSYSKGAKVRQHSAPVNIPDWSKIYGPSSKKSVDHGLIDHESWENEDEYEAEEEEDDDLIPPHVWIARKVSRNGMFSAFSVCEGAGRTLKGRDLSRMRNAVLAKTGFLESS